jgi:hypothetical protein
MTDVLLLVVCLLLAFSCRFAGKRWSRPFVAFYGVWSVIFLLRIVLPMGVSPTSGLSAVIVGIGLAGLAAGLLVTSPRADLRRPHVTEGRRPNDDGAPPPIELAALDTRRLLWAAAALLAAALYGLLKFREIVSIRAGAAFGDLTRQQVLYYETHVNAPSSKAVLLLSLCPVLAAVGVLLGRRHRVGYILVVAALAISTESPSRTETISAAGLALATYLYLGGRTRSSGRRDGVPGGVRLAALLVLVTALALVYFNIEGAALKKSSDPRPGVPAALSSLADPVIYATGSISALSVAAGSPLGLPPETAHLRSIWLVPRILSAVDPTTRVPDTVAGFVDIPEPFNTYTMFGDMYFDFGLGGVVVISMLSGVLFGCMHRRVVAEPSPANAWTSAVCLVVLFGGISGFRLLWLDTATWFICGALILWWVRAGRDLPGDISRSGTARRSAGGSTAAGATIALPDGDHFDR